MLTWLPSFLTRYWDPMANKKIKKHVEVSAPEAPRILLTKRQLAFIVPVAAILLAMAGLTAYTFAYQHRFLPRTSIAGVAVGGLTKEQAAAALAERTNEFLDRTIVFSHEGQTWEFVPRSYGAEVLAGPAITSAWAEQKSGGWQGQVGKLLKALVQTSHFQAELNVFSTETKTNLTTGLLQDLQQPYQEVDLAIAPGKVEVIAGTAGETLDWERLHDDLYALLESGGSTVTLRLVPFTPELAAEQAAAAKRLAEAVIAQPWNIVLSNTKTVRAEPALVATWLDTEVARAASGQAQGLNLIINPEVFAESMVEWSAQVDRPAVNAQLGLKDEKVVVVGEGRDGTTLNKDKTLAAARSTLLNYTGGTRELKAVVEALQPAVRPDTLASLGLTELVGKGSTDFTGSPANRKANIILGQKKLHGTLVAPGATYSTIENLGPIDEAAGFLAELVIKNNRTLPEAGGGLCQVSTTLFRAVLNAGMPIVERRNHSYRVSYYERNVGPGLDATIYEPKPDFRWRNDLSSHILVQSFVVGNEITFELYGTNDGRAATVGKPVVLEYLPVGSPIYIETDTLFVGEERQLEKPHDGAKTTVNYKVVRAGKEIINQDFFSTYRAWPAQYLVGTKPNPNATPSPTPQP